MMKLTKSGNYNRLSFCLCALICLSLQSYAETGHADRDDDGEGDVYKAVEFMFAWEMFNKANALPADSNAVAQSMPHVKIVPAVSDQNSLTIPKISITPPAITTDSNAIEQLVPQVKMVPAVSDSNNTLFEQKPDANEINYQLWKSRTAASKDTNADKSKTELNFLIGQIGSIEFKSQGSAPEPLIVEEQETINVPDEVLADAGDSQEKVSSDKTEPNLPNKKITDKTMAKLQELLQNPEQLPNPFELGEVLFSSGYFVEASKCYQEALDRMNKKANSLPQDKGWILFQIGNCLQHNDPKVAVENYRNAIKEYNESQWKDLAQAKIDLLEWYLKDTPESLIKQSKL